MLFRSQDGYKLLFEGCLVDTVSITLPLNLSVVSSKADILEEIARFLKAVNDKHATIPLKPATQQPEEIVFRVLCGDIETVNGTETVNRTETRRIDPSKPWQTVVPRGSKGIELHPQRRSLIVTHSGYVCLAPTSTRINDFICIFGGINMPFVMRWHDRQARRLLRFLGMLPPNAREYALRGVRIPLERLGVGPW